MKLFKDNSEFTQKLMMRCAGYVRKYGWPENAAGMVVSLSGPTFYRDPLLSDIPGHYSFETMCEFMVWQEENFG